MKNEFMAKAVSNIDDDLIAEAHAEAKVHTKVLPKIRVRRGGLCAAACLILLCASVFIAKDRMKIDVAMYGDTLSGEPVAVTQNTTDPGPVVPYKNIDKTVSVPIELHVSAKTKIMASAGTIEAVSAKTGDTVASGSEIVVKGNLNIVWTIENPDESKTYTLEIGDSAETVILYRENGSWLVARK